MEVETSVPAKLSMKCMENVRNESIMIGTRDKRQRLSQTRFFHAKPQGPCAPRPPLKTVFLSAQIRVCVLSVPSTLSTV